MRLHICHDERTERRRKSNGWIFENKNVFEWEMQEITLIRITWEEIMYSLKGSEFCRLWNFQIFIRTKMKFLANKFEEKKPKICQKYYVILKNQFLDVVVKFMLHNSWSKYTSFWAIQFNLAHFYSQPVSLNWIQWSPSKNTWKIPTVNETDQSPMFWKMR